MSYLVLARKYRPQTFDDVVKQDHVTQTLKNAITAGRVAHAMLFSGPRGTGKTTIARILAKAMNCEKGPTPVPCNECRSCVEITSGNAADVIEIDGASNNGVDHIRELRDHVRYMPAHSPYKIYIIDEVHMLSVPAFNALLKTLEEPPSHAMFFFATTEPHKIPITILSRCQRHELRHIDIESVKQHLEKLCRQEGVDYTGESLDIVARESGGSMRDAISLLDQVIICSEGTIRHEQVLDILGIIDRKVLFDIASGIFKGDISELLAVLEQLYEHGHNMKELYSDLIEHFRNLLVVKIGKKTEMLVNVPTHERNFMQQQVQTVSVFQISRILDILSKEETSIRYASRPKLAIEMVFIRLLEAKPILPMDVLIEKLEDLKRVVMQSSGYPEISSPETSFNETQSKFHAQTTKPEQTGQRTHTDSAQEKEHHQTAQPVSHKPDRTAGQAGLTHESALTALVDYFTEKNPPLAAVLEKCSVRQITDTVLAIDANSNGFSIKNIQKHITSIDHACRQLFGKKFEMAAGQKESVSVEPPKPLKSVNQADTIRQEALNHPMITKAMQLFKGKIVDVKLLQENQRRDS